MDGKIFYLTKGKLRELKNEYEKLVVFEHSKIMGQEAPKILESEDLNPEFVSFQEDIDFLRSRIDELKNILSNYKLIKMPLKERRMFVDLGAKVQIEVAGKKDEFTIVGTLEANPNLGRISNESPVGKALLGHKIGEKIAISSPIETTYIIKKIKYEIS
jgi:transcription elongation factor GreA